MNLLDQNRFNIQETMYNFPYHYIPHFEDKYIVSRSRVLKWGFEYLCYIMHTKELVESLEPFSILDVGCGDGRFLGLLNDKVTRKLGVDLSEKAIQFAKAFNYDNSMEFKAVNACHIEEEFDIVTAIEVLEHVPDNEINSFLETLAEKTRSGGYVLISVPTTATPVNKKHYRHYNYELLMEQLNNSGAKLEAIKSDYVYRETALSQLYLMLTDNRFWYIELKPFNKYFWNYVWNKLRWATKQDGRHLIVLLKKQL